MVIAILNPQPDGRVTRSFTGADVKGITTYLPKLPDGSDPVPSTRPTIPGDVYSYQPDGSLQGRVAGTKGDYELAASAGLTLAYRPVADGPIIVDSLV